MARFCARPTDARLILCPPCLHAGRLLAAVVPNGQGADHALQAHKKSAKAGARPLCSTPAQKWRAAWLRLKKRNTFRRVRPTALGPLAAAASLNSARDFGMQIVYMERPEPDCAACARSTLAGGHPATDAAIKLDRAAFIDGWMHLDGGADRQDSR